MVPSPQPPPTRGGGVWLLFLLPLPLWEGVGGRGSRKYRTMTDTFDDLRDLYQEVILDHGRRPRHARRLESFDATAKGDNPMCGDRIEVWVNYAPDGTIADTGFEARGCAISVASADLMAETVIGRSKSDTHALFDAFREMARTGACPHCDAA